MSINNEVIKSEWEMVRTHAGMLDLTHRGKILVRGKDNASFLHNMLSNDIKGLALGKCCYATLLTPKGKIISDMHVYAFDDFLCLELDVANLSKVIDRLNAFIITEDVELRDVSDEYGLFSIQGPLSEKYLDPASSSMASLQIPDRVREESRVDDISGSVPESFSEAAPLSRGNRGSIHFGDDKSLIFPNDRTGIGGSDIWVPIEERKNFGNMIQNLGISFISPEAFEILRIEAGIPIYGKELDENTIPNEANLERAISWTKGCYPGQEVVARIKYRGGVQRILCGLVIPPGDFPSPKDKILKDSNVVGILTSTAYSFYLKLNIALGYIRTPAAIPGNIFQIHQGEKIISAQVQTLPFIPKIP